MLFNYLALQQQQKNQTTTTKKTNQIKQKKTLKKPQKKASYTDSQLIICIHIFNITTTLQFQHCQQCGGNAQLCLHKSVTVLKEIHFFLLYLRLGSTQTALWLKCSVKMKKLHLKPRKQMRHFGFVIPQSFHIYHENQNHSASVSFYQSRDQPTACVFLLHSFSKLNTSFRIKTISK